jgi:pyruvate/2-oxoglutarate dehydrogenase complex dihydrolipoamide acyltransferase (E2) component
MIKGIMPKLGLIINDGTIVKWLKAEGETVEKWEPLLKIETEKIARARQSVPTARRNRTVITTCHK